MLIASSNGRVVVPHCYDGSRRSNVTDGPITGGKIVAIEMVADSERLGQLDLVVLDD